MSAATGLDGQGRLEELEVRLALVDDQLEALNRTVFRQQQQIDQLTQALAALRQQVRGAAPAPSGDARDEVPPHY